MENKKAEIDALLKSFKEREKEQFELLSITRKLAVITDIEALSLFIHQNLQQPLHFDNLVICSTDALEKEYQVIFHDNSKEFVVVKDEYYPIKDGFFDVALESAELIRFSYASHNKKNGNPNFIEKAFASGIKEIIAYPLHYQESNPTILFLLYKRPQNFERNTLRFLNGLSIQLAITITNISLANTFRRQPKATSNLEKKQEKISEVIKGSKEIIGNSKPTQKIKSLIEMVSPSDSSVLILGESGTGKELVAQAIHRASAYKENPMIVINCAAIPANLIESELFGHEKGSFTGATEKRIGKFELANNSTLFLDEIGELPLELQTKLLRALQEKEMERIGGKQTIKVKVRIIAATNRDLAVEMQEGRFRSDLFYRLNVFPIAIPPLRDRKEDIPELCTHFLSKYTLKSAKKEVVLSAKALRFLLHYPWPGNIRELEHCIERNIVLSNGKVIDSIDLSQQTSAENPVLTEEFKIKSLKEVEKEHILSVVKQTNGRISGPNGAAKILGLPSTTLISKMQKLGIKKEHFFNPNED